MNGKNKIKNIYKVQIISVLVSLIIYSILYIVNVTVDIDYIIFNILQGLSLFFASTLGLLMFLDYLSDDIYYK